MASYPAGAVIVREGTPGGSAFVIMSGRCRAFRGSASSPVELRESQELRLMRLHPGSIIKPALGTILVPKPMTARVGGRPVRDREVLAWAGEVISSVVMDNVAQAAAVAASRG